MGTGIPLDAPRQGREAVAQRTRRRSRSGPIASRRMNRRGSRRGRFLLAYHFALPATVPVVARYESLQCTKYHMSADCEDFLIDVHVE